MLRINQGILALNIKLIESDIMEEHVDTAEVIGGDVDLLSEEACLHCIFAQDFFYLK